METARLLNRILKQRASEAEIEQLNELGFNFKRPTRWCVVLISLYKKAAAGDLSAAKELLHLCGEIKEDSSQRVVIIDDIESKH